MIPTLRTARLILRAPAESDWPALAAYGRSARTRFTGGPVDGFGAWRGLLAAMGHWSLRGYGFFSIDDRESGAFVGRAGVIRHIDHAEPELAWHLFDGCEGRGHATEAAAAVRDWFAGAVSPAPLMSGIDPENRASERVAERLGATREGWQDHPRHGRLGLWRHLRGAA